MPAQIAAAPASLAAGQGIEIPALLINRPLAMTYPSRTVGKASTM